MFCKSVLLKTCDFNGTVSSVSRLDILCELLTTIYLTVLTHFFIMNDLVFNLTCHIKT